MNDLGFTETLDFGLILNGFTRDQHLVWNTLDLDPPDPPSGLYTVTEGAPVDLLDTLPSINADPSFGVWYYYAPPYLAPEPGTIAPTRSQ